MAEEATAASQLLKQGAGELSALVGRFKLNGHQLQIKNLVDFSPITHEAEATAPSDDVELQVAVGSGGRGIWQDF
jgi:hypothetical protein